MRFKKKRKPRGYKKNGYKSGDMCPHCYSAGCDPFAHEWTIWGRKRDKRFEERRSDENLCIACGNSPCICKSSLNMGERLTKSQRDKIFEQINKFEIGETVSVASNFRNQTRYGAWFRYKKEKKYDKQGKIIKFVEKNDSHWVSVRLDNGKAELVGIFDIKKLNEQ